MVTPVGLGVAATFAAYLLGSLSQPLLDPILGAIRVRLGDLLFRLKHRGEDPRRWFWLDVERPVCVAGELSGAGSHELATYVATHVRDIRAKRAGRHEGYDEHYDIGYHYQQVFRQLKVVERRLIGDQPDLYAETVRLRSEGELRNAIAPPLAVLTVVLAVESRLWWMAALVLITGLGVTAVLWELGQRRRRASNDLLVEALALGRVNAPAIERLHAAVEKTWQPPR